jgi:transposase-like protein
MHNRKQQISNSINNIPGNERPDPEVVPTAKRRSFSKAEKLRILAAADACVPGDIGALLRREGIYSSHLATWRKQRQLAGEALLVERKRGPKVNPGAAQDRLVLELKNEVARLRDKLAKADLIIDVQKKLSILLGLSTSDTPGGPK